MDKHRPASAPRHGKPRILVIRHRYVGDLVLCAPVFHNLRQHFPEAWISLVVDDKYRDVLATNQDINEILAMPARSRNFFISAMQWLRLIFQLKSRRFDTVIDLSSTGKTARLALLSGARTVSAFETKIYARKTRKRIVVSPRTGLALENRHIVDLYLSPLEALEIPVVSREVSMPLRPEDTRAAKRNVQAALGEETDFIIMVHPGARMASRRWPAARFAAVCDALQRDSGCRVLLLAGPGEEELMADIARQMKTASASLAAPLSVPALAATFSCADLLLCNDSGPMHVAAAVETPIVALFGAQSVPLWHPTSNSVVLQASLPCLNCLFPETCQPPDDYQMLCIQRIETNEAIEAVMLFKDRLQNQKNNARTSAETNSS